MMILQLCLFILASTAFTQAAPVDDNKANHGVTSVTKQLETSSPKADAASTNVNKDIKTDIPTTKSATIEESQPSEEPKNDKTTVTPTTNHNAPTDTKYDGPPNQHSLWQKVKHGVVTALVKTGQKMKYKITDVGYTLGAVAGIPPPLDHYASKA